MADFPGKKVIIQTEQVQTRKPLSEFLMQGLGGSTNFLFETYIPFYKFTANGRYGSAAGQTMVDGLFVPPFNGEIVGATIYSAVPGSSGTTELDIKYTNDNGATWTSIFSTTPKVDSASGLNTYCGINDTVVGYTPAVLSADPFPFVIGDAFRMDVITTMVGAPSNTGLILFFQPRNL